MKIQSYQIQQSSIHNQEQSREKSERMDFWTGNARRTEDDAAAYVLDIGFKATGADIKKASETDDQDVKDTQTETKLRLIEALMYQMTGKRIKLQAQTVSLGSSSVQMQQPDAKLNMIQERDSWGLIYEYQETMAENESIQYNSGGTVTTSDGKTLLFSTEFSMARSFYEQNRVNIRLGNAVMVDPLMMVMRGGKPTLSRDKVSFDLDSDGSAEEIVFAADGSGFLALDRNGDGIINDGTELFGPLSGDGFKELRVFDMDRNDWIDESDEVFSRLSLLSLSDNGEKTLVKLADVGVGAIYLDEISTPFEFKEEADTFGAMRSSSVFLREDGSAGTIHHVDLSL